jgi:hypothetical protein
MSSKGGLSAKIELPAPAVRAGDRLEYSIVNTGSVELICGLPYRLERYADNAWILMNPNMAFALPGFGVKPGQTHLLTALVPAIAPAGKYRISTSVATNPLDEGHGARSVQISAQFDVHRVDWTD